MISTKTQTHRRYIWKEAKACTDRCLILVLTCKWASDRHVHPVDWGNWRRSLPKTWIPAATLGRPPVLRSGLLFDHFGKDCWHVVRRLFRLAPVSGNMNHRFISSRCIHMMMYNWFTLVIKDFLSFFYETFAKFYRHFMWHIFEISLTDIWLYWMWKFMYTDYGTRYFLQTYN